MIRRVAIACRLLWAAPATGAEAHQRDYVGLVNPWVEADIGRYFFFQSASKPFGFVKLRPDTSTGTAWGTGYRRNEDQVKGFSHLHDWQLSGVQVMPTCGPSGRQDAGRGGLAVARRPRRQRGRPARLPPAASSTATASPPS